MKERNFGYSNTGEFPVRFLRGGGRNPNSSKNLNHGFKTLGVSIATQKKISKHCRVLALASKKRTVRTSSGKYISHLNIFITLTLPSEQVHTDQEITKKVLGKFFDKCRKLSLLQNYVWRAEKQLNGNIHYHILSDTFCNYSMLRRIWYSAIRELGYMDRYTEKFLKMDLPEYSRQAFNKKRTPTEIASAYGRGVQTGWSEPPACHVEYISSTEGVIKYVAKYVSKSSDGSANIVEGRSWGCSQSVSQSVTNFCKDQEFSKDWFIIGKEMMHRKTIDGDFFSVCLFKISSLTAWFPEFTQRLINFFSECFTPCPYWRNSVGLQL